MTGKLIKIFLIEGSASGLRTAELGLSTIKALVVPRASLSDAANRFEIQKTGIYILVGPDADKPGQRMVYIGEGDTIFTRLKAHDKDEAKDFWEEAVVFISVDENLTKAHARYLEARLITLADRAKRATVVNGTAPSGQERFLPESELVMMEEFIVQARLLLGTLGYSIFEPVSVSATARPTTTGELSDLSPLFYYQGNGFDAICYVDREAGQFILRAGSKARKLEVPSLPKGIRNIRAQLIDSGILHETGKDSYDFTQDYSFGSMSTAASVVSGTSVNGRLAWRDQNGRTFAEWQDSLIADQEQSTPI